MARLRLRRQAAARGRRRRQCAGSGGMIEGVMMMLAETRAAELAGVQVGGCW